MMRDEELVCFCSQVTAGTVRQAMRAGATSMDAVRSMTGACTLGRCKELSPRGR